MQNCRERNTNMNLKEVCRTCLQRSESMQSIFSLIQTPNLELSNLSILQLLKIFTNITVSSNDGLPNNFCSDCLGKLHQSYTFKLKCEKAEAIWKQLKQDEKSVSELKYSANVQFEHYTETSIKPIKTEIVEDYETSSDKQLESISIPENGVSKQEIPCVQEIKQEPEIDINTEESHLIETDLGAERLKNDLHCTVCRKMFTNKYNLKVHMRRVHTIDIPFKCKDCSATFRSKDDLKEHMQHCHFNCEICLKIFSRKSRLIAHMRLHTGEKPFQCKMCPKKFRLKFCLKSHLESVHADEAETVINFKCETCSKLFGLKSNLTHHMKIHTGEKPFQCELCPKKFRSKRQLRSHVLKSHTDCKAIKNYKCATCSKSFEYKSSLNHHLLIHTGEKKFQCEFCTRNFRSKSNLVAHMQTVHADGTNITERFKCTLCSKLCISQAYLNQHMAIHTGEKPFQCESCPAQFRFKNNLKRHIQTLHADSTKNNLNV